MGQKQNNELLEAVSDICFGVAEVDFSANQVHVLHNALRPDEVGQTFPYDEYVKAHLSDLENDQEVFADLLTRQELLDSLASGQTTIDINAHICTIKVKFFTKDRTGRVIYFSSRSPKAPNVQPSTVPYNSTHDDLWVGTVGGDGASVLLGSTAGFTHLPNPKIPEGAAQRHDYHAPDDVYPGLHQPWNGVERRGQTPQSELLAVLSPQDGAAFLAQRMPDIGLSGVSCAPGKSGASGLSTRRDKSDVPTRYAVPETDPAAKHSEQHMARADLHSYLGAHPTSLPAHESPELKEALHDGLVAAHELPPSGGGVKSATGPYDDSWLAQAHIFKSGERTKVSIAGLDLPQIVATSPIFAHFIVLKSATNNILQQITTAFVFANCDYFIYIDPRKGSALMFVGSQSGTPLPPRYTNDYNAESVRYAQRFVVPEDRIAAIRDMELNHVIEMLQHKEAYITYCGVQDPVRGYTRKRLEYRYTDEERKMISLVRTDITEIYELERFHRMKLQEALDLAYSDPLTSVLNKHGFTTRASALLTDLELQCKRCRSGRQQLRSDAVQSQDFALHSSAGASGRTGPHSDSASSASGGVRADSATRASGGASASGEARPNGGVRADSGARAEGGREANPGVSPILLEPPSPATCLGNDCTFAGALLFIDLDNFKPVNDTYGHMVGDEVLIKVASLIKSCVRTTDLVGRYGGDEFVVYLLCIGRKATACSIAQRICDSIAALRYRSQGEQINLSCSIGLAMAPYDGFTYDDLVTMADHRLYLAKNQGKDKVVASSYGDAPAHIAARGTSPEQEQILAQLYPYCSSCAERGYCQVAAAMLREFQANHNGLHVPAHVWHD